LFRKGRYFNHRFAETRTADSPAPAATFALAVAIPAAREQKSWKGGFYENMGLGVRYIVCK